MTPEILLTAVYPAWSKCLPSPFGDGTFSPTDSTTFCNEFVQMVCGSLLYKKFDGMLANEMAQYMANHQNEWTAIAGSVAQIHANVGGLVLAAWINQDGPHGHVDVVIPGIAVESGKWNDVAPIVANVGGIGLCFIGKGANFAFAQEPRYFCLNSSLES